MEGADPPQSTCLSVAIRRSVQPSRLGCATSKHSPSLSVMRKCLPTRLEVLVRSGVSPPDHHGKKGEGGGVQVKQPFLYVTALEHELKRTIDYRRTLCYYILLIIA